jgi:hypothetical protein
MASAFTLWLRRGSAGTADSQLCSQDKTAASVNWSGVPSRVQDALHDGGGPLVQRR